MTVMKLCSQNIELWPSVETSTTHLNLDHNLLSEIPESITLLENLETLSAIGNDIEYISPKIGSLTCLREVNLIENNIESLPESICQLRLLTKLCLLGNGLYKLPDDIGALKNLEYLNISENRLDTLPETFGSLQSLKFLDASVNDLVELPHKFGALSNLHNLNFSENGLMSLPQSFSELPSIEILDLSNNSITFLPDNFQSSTCIKELYLDINTLSALPPWFSNMPCLVKISVSENKLEGEALPVDIGFGCPRIEHLDLSGNRLTVVPKSILNLTSLRFFDLGSVLPELERRAELLNGNALLRLPEGFGVFNNLVELSIDENPLLELPLDFGELMTSLEILDLGQDSLTRLPDSFCNMCNLHTLSLAMNGLQSLPEDFGNLTSLISLRLDHNALVCLPESFGQLSNLEQLDLYHNMLPEFPPCLYNMENIKALNVEGNKFKMSEALHTRVPLKYPEMKSCDASSNLSGKNEENNWRRKIGSYRQDCGEVEVLNCASSEEDDEFEVVEGYRLSQLRRAAARGLTAWQSHSKAAPPAGPEDGVFTPLYRPPSASELIDIPQEEDYSQGWDNPTYGVDEEEDWDSCTQDDNPYGLPVVYQHPSLHPAYRLDHRFTPADIHRPSYLHLFQRTDGGCVQVEEGQFDDPDPVM